MDDTELVESLREDDVREENDIDRIDPVPETLELKCGIEVHLLPLRTRQLFKLLRVITHGAGQALMQSGLDFQEDPAVFLQKLVGLVLFSIPDAEQETIDFLQAMVEPTNLVDKQPRDMNTKERDHNVELWTKLNTELWNPDPGDTIDIIEAVVRREASDLQALGKRIRQFLEIASKTGQLKAQSNGGGKALQDLKLPDSSPEPSISSPASTAGRTRKSSTSPSAASGTSSPRSARASTKKSVPGAALLNGRLRLLPYLSVPGLWWSPSTARILLFSQPLRFIFLFLMRKMMMRNMRTAKTGILRNGMTWTSRHVSR